MHPADLFTLLLSTVRYSLGRRTYMSTEAPELVCKYGSSLEYWQLQQIADEIDRVLTEYERAETTLGDRCDHESWRRGVERMREMLEQREKEGEAT